MKKRGKVGLALGGGGARGFAHIGVLDVLQQEEVPIDMIAGASFGALIGAIYAQGKDTKEMKNVALEFNWKKLISLADFNLHKSGFIGGRRIENLLKSIMGGDVKFNELNITLACVATDVNTCGEVIIDQGSVLDAIRASISIPGIFTVVKWRGRYLVDGGLVDPVPVSVLQRMGADFIIAVNVIPDIHHKVMAVDEDVKLDLKEPSIFSVIMQSIQRAQCLLVKSSIQGADIIISPNVVHIGFGDFHRAQECIKQGEIAARDSIWKIKKYVKGT